MLTIRCEISELHQKGKNDNESVYGDYGEWKEIASLVLESMKKVADIKRICTEVNHERRQAIITPFAQKLANIMVAMRRFVDTRSMIPLASDLLSQALYDFTEMTRT